MRHILPVASVVLTILACIWTRQSFARAKVYYNTRPISMRGKASRAQLPAGQRLRFVSDNGGIWRMTDGLHLIDVERASLTDDKQFAGALIYLDFQRGQDQSTDQSGGGYTEVESVTAAKILCAP